MALAAFSCLSIFSAVAAAAAASGNTGATPRARLYVPQPGPFRPVSTGPGGAQIPAGMDVGEFIANYELGGGNSPPLGARSAGAPSSPVNRNLNIAGFQTPGNLDRSQVIPFTPANFNSPSLNLVGGYELTRAVRDLIRSQYLLKSKNLASIAKYPASTLLLIRCMKR